MAGRTDKPFVTWSGCYSFSYFSRQIVIGCSSFRVTSYSLYSLLHSAGSGLYCCAVFSVVEKACTIILNNHQTSCRKKRVRLLRDGGKKKSKQTINQGWIYGYKRFTANLALWLMVGTLACLAAVVACGVGVDFEERGLRKKGAPRGSEDGQTRLGN